MATEQENTGQLQKEEELQDMRIQPWQLTNDRYKNNAETNYNIQSNVLIKCECSNNHVKVKCIEVRGVCAKNEGNITTEYTIQK
jgi:hypothetical protein